MAEELSQEDLARLKRGFELFNQGDFDALRDFVSPDVILDRVGELPPIHGWEAFRAFQEPDSFEWQRIHPLEWTVNADKVLLRVLIQSKGATSGVELEVEGWMVWTLLDGLVVRLSSFLREADARAAAGLGQNDSQ